MEVFDKIDLILGLLLVGLILVLFFISYLIKVTLEQNKVRAYSMIGVYCILNIGRLKRIINKDSTARFLYYFTILTLILIALIILYFVLMILLNR